MLCNRASIFLVYWDFNVSILLKGFGWWGLMEWQIIPRMYHCYYFLLNTAMFAAYVILNLKVLSNLRPAFSFDFNSLAFVIFIVLSHVQCCCLILQLSRIFSRMSKQSCCGFNYEVFHLCPPSKVIPIVRNEKMAYYFKSSVIYRTVWILISFNFHTCL